MKKELSVGFVVLFLALAQNGRAEEPNSPLIWDACVAITLKNNPDLGSASRAVEASRATYRGSFNGFFPQFSLSNSYSDSASLQAAGPGAEHWQAQGSVGLNFWNMGQIASIKAASAGLTLAEANRRSASSDLRFNLRRAFAGLLFAQQNVEVSKMILEMRRKSAQLVALRYNSGRESKGNMLRSKAQALQAEAALNQALRDLRTAERTLDRQLGADSFEAVTVSGTLTTQEPPQLPEDTVFLLANRPDVAAGEASIQSARAAVKRAESGLWPSLSASYGRSRSGTAEFPSDRLSWNLGGVLSWPIFGSGPTAVYFEVSASKHGLEKAREDLRSIRDQAVVDIETSWSGFSGAVDQVRVQAALLEAARQRNSEADVRYASGLLSYDNWEIIASDRISTERQTLQAGLNAVNAEAGWNKATGKLLEEN